MSSLRHVILALWAVVRRHPELTVRNLALLGLPIAVATAILRYRLYEIDVPIRWTLVYGLTTGSLAVAFFAGIIVLQTVLRPFTAGSEIAFAEQLRGEVDLDSVRVDLLGAVDQTMSPVHASVWLRGAIR